MYVNLLLQYYSTLCPHSSSVFTIVYMKLLVKACVNRMRANFQIYICRKVY